MQELLNKVIMSTAEFGVLIDREQAFFASTGNEIN